MFCGGFNLRIKIVRARQLWDNLYLRNRKYFPCFYRIIETRVEVWENEKCCGNTSRRRVFSQLFRVLPNFHECFCNSVETWKKWFWLHYPIRHNTTKAVKCSSFFVIFLGLFSYFAGTDQRTGSGVWWELWIICCTNSDPLEIWISLARFSFLRLLFVLSTFPLSLHGVVALAYGLENTFPRSQRVLGFRIRQVPSVFAFNKF